MRIGYKLIAEGYGPTEMVRQCVLAEQAGFDFVEISDHFHPWVSEQQHSGFAWSMLAAMAARTERIELATGVTCPFIRYHPAVIAQAAATTQLLAEGRFTLGVGAGERLNEHVVGQGWPAVHVRHEMFRESLEIIRLLWQGGYRNYEGKHLTLEDARVFDLPETLPKIVVAAGGPRAAALAGELGDGLFVTEPRADLVEAYGKAGGDGPRYAEVPLAYAATAQEAAQSARDLFRFGLTGWKVQAELPNPVNFDAATSWVTPEHMREAFGCGPDTATHVESARPFADAGYDHLALINAGPDVDGFFEHARGELIGALREL
ncbi:TIGR03557 family F420-dependent LLM class oxidoreductase [Actinomycetospora sp. TBRC 11914]|uniref:TIGR03557 family F420-dependent LLM class oxidoreductase n=1 Tax=Actinomycetospora sp. TBRC 11914 TaxID=2729387 RepID=UPI00145F98C6|nr:TIGR03557 family F420-dependent LLM class oxidoreductase [Actinomycetospora sp. TBRC 11914]NMO90090.1 TIGR03557 family F420-dependent LLM class oxidoreductase [Actinomycetospora sp. TBRC 11914]